MKNANECKQFPESQPVLSRHTFLQISAVILAAVVSIGAELRGTLRADDAPKKVAAVLPALPSVIPCGDGKANVKKFPVEGAKFTLIALRNLHNPSLGEKPTPTEEKYIKATDLENGQLVEFLLKNHGENLLSLEGYTVESEKECIQALEKLRQFKEQLQTVTSTIDAVQKNVALSEAEKAKQLTEPRKKMAALDAQDAQMRRLFALIKKYVIPFESVLPAVLDKTITIAPAERNKTNAAAIEELSRPTGEEQKKLIDDREDVCIELAIERMKQANRTSIITIWGAKHWQKQDEFPRRIAAWNTAHPEEKIDIVIMEPPSERKFAKRLKLLDDKIDELKKKIRDAQEKKAEK
jgi:hypothetical protein